MKALVLSAIREVTLREVPEPAPRPDQALIKVIGTGICGSDMSGFLGHSTRRIPPLILGHEVIGTVVSAPPGNWPFRVGARVVANPLQSCGVCENCRAGQPNICDNWTIIGMDREPGAFSEYTAIAARNVFPLDEGVSEAQAVMVEPLANGVHLFSLIRRHRFGTLTIFGAGTQGILMLQLARMLGYRRIAVVDVNPARLAVAKHFGASLILNPTDGPPVAALLEWTDGRGADIGIDAVGSPATRQGLIESVRKGGEIMMLGLHDRFTEADFARVVRNELRLQGSFTYTPGDFQTSKRLLENGDISIEPWTKFRSLEEGQTAFDLLVSDPGDTLKVVLKP